MGIREAVIRADSGAGNLVLRTCLDDRGARYWALSWPCFCPVLAHVIAETRILPSYLVQRLGGISQGGD